MFGFVPVWAWWLSGGWAAKTVMDKMKPPPGGRVPMPVAQAGAQSGPVAPQQPPQQIVIQGPPAARAGRPCQFDPHMDERTESAVVKCLQQGNIEKLRGFADSVTTKLPPQAYPYGYFPVAATIMRMQATLLEQQAQAQAAVAPPPVPPPPVAPSKQANGAAAAPVAAIVAASEVISQPEG